jgi:thymidylate synthase (FAD)
MGDDLAVVNAARVSFAKEAERMGDQEYRLLDYLAKHKHWTPFAHTAIKLRLSAPVPIRTQCFKHKAGFVENEESRRYISCRPELYIPNEFRAKPAGSIKQGSGDVHQDSKFWRDQYIKYATHCIDMYDAMVEDGVCPEQARLLLPQGVLVNWVWTGNLAAFARFYNQRTDPHAQLEVQSLAQEVGAIIQPLFPHSWKALTSQ